MNTLDTQFSRVAGCMSLVEHAALAARGNSRITHEDLVSIGKVALVTCVQAVGPGVDEVEFRAIAYTRVRGAMLDELRKADPLTRQKRTCVRAVRGALESLTKGLHREPTLLEIRQATGLEIVAIRRALDTIESGDDRSATEWEQGNVVDENAPVPSTAAEGGDVRELLEAALAQLSPRQATVLKAYYLDEMTLQEVAAAIGCTAENVRILRDAGVEKLRRNFAALGLWQVLISRSCER